MKLKRDDFCPLLKEPCRQLGCNWFISMRGINPNTGEEIDDWRCTMAFLPLMVMEGASQTRQAGASIDMLRKEVDKRANDAALGIAHARSAPEPKLIEAAE